MKPGVYPGLPMAEYLRIEAASAGLLTTIIEQCPAAAWFASPMNPQAIIETDDAADFGTIAHEILLEGTRDCVEVIDPADYPSKNGNIPDGWKNVAIRAARDDARAAGKIPVLVSDIATINNMVDSAQAFIESVRETEPAIWRAFQPNGGDSELTCVWDEDGVLCRMRADRISRERDVIIDCKFTKRAAEPDSFARTQFSAMGYRMTASHYRRGASVLFGISPAYVFLVVEQDPPHLCSLVGVDPANFALGDEQRAHAMREFRRCLTSGKWPAYPTRVCYPEVAAWEIARWQERQGLEAAHGIQYDIDKLFKRKEAA